VSGLRFEDRRKEGSGGGDAAVDDADET